ncbi:MAG: PD-(D/E)XK nuclease family protein [Bacteroidetes bacterium]|nr:PD-(D/E)XK nuclease family protein [Bacteroidota bacterium]
MSYFLELVAQQVQQKYAHNLNSICLVLPNKRGGLFLKKQLQQVLSKPSWMPEIISTEEFIEKTSGLFRVPDLHLSFSLYQSYCRALGSEALPFDQFLNWSPQALQDFNEIDRYLVDEKKVFENLRDIKEIESWSLGKESLSAMQEKYLTFMQHLGAIYADMKHDALQKNEGWQGLAYRVAYQKIVQENAELPYSQVLFCGFNAMNFAEEKIIKHLVEKNKATLLWDADTYYTQDLAQEAGLFLRKHFVTFHTQTQFVSSELSKSKKHIEISGVAGRVAQVTAAVQALNKIKETDPQLQKTAVVLADETLLLPLLSALPQDIGPVNITLEYPTRITTLYSLYEETMQMHFNKKGKSFYFKDVLAVLYNPSFSELCHKKTRATLLQKINEGNFIYLSFSTLKEYLGDAFEAVEPLFSLVDNQDTKELVQNLCLFNDNLIQKLQQVKKDSIELEVALIFRQQLHVLRHLLQQHVVSLKALRILMKQVLSPMGISFYGEPLSGLQIMGVLETRTLDFNHVIMLSVNENVLPSGKSGDSFIVDDLKRFLNMPLPHEKDAIYAYHFYRLLQRSQSATLIYNTESDTFGKGERSRFITQLLSEFPKKNTQSTIKEQILTFPSETSKEPFAIIIKKTEAVMKSLVDRACATGFSPSSLKTYKECSLKFYFYFVANIKESDEVDEDIESSTVGSIAHKVLELLFKPFVKERPLSESDIETMQKKYEQEIETAFAESYKEGAGDNGKRIITLHVIKKYIARQLEREKEVIRQLEQKKKTRSIIAVEEKLKAALTIETDDGPLSAIVNGTIDRIDQSPGSYRVVDYKSSVGGSDKFDVESIEAVFTEEKYDKALQLMVYAWLVWKNKKAEAKQIQPCIIPFKAEKSEYRLLQNKVDFEFNDDILGDFENLLGGFIKEIFDQNTDFSPTQDEEKCKYCAYKRICNRN